MRKDQPQVRMTDLVTVDECHGTLPPSDGRGGGNLSIV